MASSNDVPRLIQNLRTAGTQTASRLQAISDKTDLTAIRTALKAEIAYQNGLGRTEENPFPSPVPTVAP